MLLVSWRDLQWRRRRYLVVLVAAALVFTGVLILAGLARAFRAEGSRTIDALGVDGWVAAEGSVGPFFTAAPQSVEVADSLPVEADPLVVTRITVGMPPRDVVVVGAVPGGVGSPTPASGRPVQGPGEALADVSLGVAVGERAQLGALDVEVVGLLDGVTVYAGTPVVVVALEDAQRMVFGGAELATVIGVRGSLDRAPPGTVLLDDADARADLLRPLLQAVQTVDGIQLLLWLVAVCIIGAIIFLSALERTRDFAVLKATGTASRSIFAGLALQSVVVSLVAAGLAIGIAVLVAPLLALRVEIPLSGMLLLPALAVGVGLLASLAGVARAVRVDPAQAFGGP